MIDTKSLLPKTIEDLIDRSLFLYILITLITVFVGVFLRNTNNNIYSYYLAFTILALTFGSFFVISKTENKSTFIHTYIKKKHLLAVVLTCISIITIFAVTREADYCYSIWLDEYVQFLYGNLVKWNGDGNISNYASTEQQPPLTYYFSGISGFIFGINHFAVKLPTILFSLSFYLFFPLMVFSLTKDIKLTIGITLFTLAHPILFFYTVEARGYSQALLFCLFTIYFTVRAYIDHSSRRWIILFFAQLIFVLSIGFQPEMFLIIVAAAFTPFLFSNSRIYLKHLLVNTFTMIFFLPYLYHIYISSVVTDKFHASLTNRILNELQNFTLNNYWDYYKDIGIVNYIFWPILLLSVVNILSNFIKFRFINLYEKLTLSLIISVLTFPWCFTIIFKTFINWHYSPRYYIVFFPLMFICFIFCFLNIKVKFVKLSNLLALLLLTSSIILFFQKSDFLKYNSRQRRMNWTKIYSHFESNLFPSDRVYHLTFNDIGDWRPDIYVSKQLYTTKTSAFINNENIHLMNSKSQIGNHLAEKKVKGDLYFISNSSRNNKKMNTFLDTPNSNFTVTNINGMLIIKIKSGIKKHKNAYSFFIELYRVFSDKTWNFLTMEILLDYYLSKNDILNAKKIIRNMKSLSLNKEKTIESSLVNKEKIRNDVINFYMKRLSGIEIDQK
jgi:hypothetical protein